MAPHHTIGRRNATLHADMAALQSAGVAGVKTLFAIPLPLMLETGDTTSTSGWVRRCVAPLSRCGSVGASVASFSHGQSPAFGVLHSTAPVCIMARGRTTARRVLSWSRWCHEVRRPTKWRCWKQSGPPPCAGPLGEH